MPKPVRFVCKSIDQKSPEEIAGLILKLDNWEGFRGWGPLPGIKKAEFLTRPEGVVGTRFGVECTDGSRYVEEIVAWELPDLLRIRMNEFPKPLGRLASEYTETFRFTVQDGGTLVEREFELQPRSMWTRPVLIVIGWMLRKAIERHNRDWGAVPC